MHDKEMAEKARQILYFKLESQNFRRSIHRTKSKHDSFLRCRETIHIPRLIRIYRLENWFKIFFQKCTSIFKRLKMLLGLSQKTSGALSLSKSYSAVFTLYFYPSNPNSFMTQNAASTGTIYNKICQYPDSASYSENTFLGFDM